MTQLTRDKSGKRVITKIAKKQKVNQSGTARGVGRDLAQEEWDAWGCDESENELVEFSSEEEYEPPSPTVSPSGSNAQSLASTQQFRYQDSGEEPPALALEGIREEPALEEDADGEYDADREEQTMFSPPETLPNGVAGMVAMPSRYDQVQNNQAVTRVLKEGLFGDDGQPQDDGVDPLVIDEGITFVSGRIRGDVKEGRMSRKAGKAYERAQKPIGWKGKSKARNFDDGPKIAPSLAQNFGLPAQAGLDNDKAAFGSQAYIKQMQEETPDQFVPRGSNIVVKQLHDEGGATKMWRVTGMPAGKMRITLRIEVKDPSQPSGWIHRQYGIKISRAAKVKKTFGPSHEVAGYMHNIDLSQLNHALAVMPPMKKRELGAVITLQAVWRARLGRKLFKAIAYEKYKQAAAIKIQACFRSYHCRKQFQDYLNERRERIRARKAKQRQADLEAAMQRTKAQEAKMMQDALLAGNPEQNQSHNNELIMQYASVPRMHLHECCGCGVTLRTTQGKEGNERYPTTIRRIVQAFQKLHQVRLDKATLNDAIALTETLDGQEAEDLMITIIPREIRKTFPKMTIADFGANMMKEEFMSLELQVCGQCFAMYIDGEPHIHAKDANRSHYDTSWKLSSTHPHETWIDPPGYPQHILDATSPLERTVRQQPDLYESPMGSKASNSKQTSKTSSPLSTPHLSSTLLVPGMSPGFSPMIEGSVVDRSAMSSPSTMHQSHSSQQNSPHVGPGVAMADILDTPIITGSRREYTPGQAMGSPIHGQFLKGGTSGKHPAGRWNGGKAPWSQKSTGEVLKMIQSRKTKQGGAHKGSFDKTRTPTALANGVRPWVPTTVISGGSQHAPGHEPPFKEIWKGGGGTPTHGTMMTTKAGAGRPNSAPGERQMRKTMPSREAIGDSIFKRGAHLRARPTKFALPINLMPSEQVLPKPAPTAPPPEITPGYGSPMLESKEEDGKELGEANELVTDQMLVPSLNKPNATGGAGFESVFKGCPPRRPVSKDYSELVKEALELSQKVMKVVPYGETEESMAIREAEEAKEAEEAAKNNALPGTEAIPNNEHGAEFIKLVRPMRGKFSLEEKHSATRYLKMKGGHNGTGGAEEGISVFARASPLDAFLALSKRSFQQSPAGKRARKSTKSKTPNGRQSPSAGPPPVPANDFSFEQAEWVKLRLQQFSSQALEDNGNPPSPTPEKAPLQALGSGLFGAPARTPTRPVSALGHRGLTRTDGRPAGMDEVDEIIRSHREGKRMEKGEMRGEEWNAKLHPKPFKV